MSSRLAGGDEPKLMPPRKCASCIWGRWEGSVQFCMKPVCIKESARTKRLQPN
ncbi:hypothetical protein [Paenibacillus hamazuiensis]|uniref:hypothetical protein n=1 Tax=Paenibacillus hamazuiensis TaxID=2936508 RepID=UPI00200E1E22|nr:hypothetical protein [Paenibacillus hamazuiensis]